MSQGFHRLAAAMLPLATHTAHAPPQNRLLTLALEKERQRAAKLQADLRAMGATDTSASTAPGGGLDAEASEQQSMLSREISACVIRLRSRRRQGALRHAWSDDTTHIMVRTLPAGS